MLCTENFTIWDPLRFSSLLSGFIFEYLSNKNFPIGVIKLNVAF